jgi:hypothetical protein
MTDYFEEAFWKLQNNWHESVKHYEERIEKLEAALRDCMEMAEVHEIPFRDRVTYISDVARKALEGER